MAKKLYRSRKNRILGGICGGIGEYFDVDPTFIRMAWVGSVLFFGTGILLYGVCWALVPSQKSF